MESAIKKAMEGGYNVGYDKENGYVYTCDNIGSKGEITGGSILHLSQVREDPEFWQALCAEDVGHVRNINLVKTMRVWHSFIDWIAEGKDINEFFNNLLK
jgi:hypothetical protein